MSDNQTATTSQTLSDVIYSDQDVAALKATLLQSTDQSFRTQSQLDDVIAVLPPHLTNAISALVSQNGQKLTEQLSSILDQLEPVHLSIAYQPSFSQLKQLATQCKAHLSPLVYLVINYQPTLLAGCQLQYAGHTYDLSLTTALQTEVSS